MPAFGRYRSIRIISPLSIGRSNHLTNLLGEEVLPLSSLHNRIIVANIGAVQRIVWGAARMMWHTTLQLPQRKSRQFKGGGGGGDGDA